MSRLRHFIRLWIFRLNNGVPSGARLITADDYNDQASVQPVKREGWRLNLILFFITFLTTTFAGANLGGGMLEVFVSGLPYSVTLLTILGIHEFGHYFAAQRFGVAATLPYFIPFPSIVGTMGAVIKTRSPIPHTRALFYIGVMGPIPGFIASLAASVVGISLSSVHPLPPSDGMTPVFGNSLLFGAIIYVVHGAIPAGYDIMLHPVAWAGWIGFLVTSLNLIPIGQLDGGHVLYSLIGRRQLYAGWCAVAVLAVLSFFWQGWIIWIMLTLFVLMVAHPYIPEKGGLSLKERAAGWACMCILALTFIPVPVVIY